jgi:hypothetical protein
VSFTSDNNFGITISNMVAKIKKIKTDIDQASDIYTVYNRLTYQIGQTYTKELTNNTITCYLIKNGSIVKTDVTMTFSQHGTAGTDYTFSMYFGKLYNNE